MSKLNGENSAEMRKGTSRREAPVEVSSAPTRRYRTMLFGVLLFSGIIAFSLLTFLVETTPSFPIDRQITRAVQSIDSPLFAGLMQVISWPGFSPQSVILTLLIAFLLYVFGLRWESVTSLLAATLSGGTNQLIKELIQRPRPAESDVIVSEILTSYSFPSGHVMFYTILFGFIWYLGYTLLKRSLLRSLLLFIFGILILFVGASRIYLGQHWASDVLGAYLLGSVLLAGILLLYQWGKVRFFTE